MVLARFVTALNNNFPSRRERPLYKSVRVDCWFTVNNISPLPLFSAPLVISENSTLCQGERKSAP